MCLCIVGFAMCLSLHKHLPKCISSFFPTSSQPPSFVHDSPLLFPPNVHQPGIPVVAKHLQLLPSFSVFSVFVCCQLSCCACVWAHSVGVLPTVLVKKCCLLPVALDGCVCVRFFCVFICVSVCCLCLFPCVCVCAVEFVVICDCVPTSY